MIWGAVHGILQILESVVLKQKKKNVGIFGKILRRVWVFIAVSFAWIFFRANSIRDALYIVKRMVSLKMVSFTNEVVQLTDSGVDKKFCFIIVIALLILLINDITKAKNGIYWFIRGKSNICYWAHTILVVGCILMFGMYGPMFDASAFIYYNF